MVIIHEIRRIGASHINHCEDYTVSEQIGENRYLLAVLDGCTMGDESYFASTLFGKLLRKIAKEAFYKEHLENLRPTINELIRWILERLFSEISQAKNLLQLERNELLSTLILCVMDEKDRIGKIVCVGDGVVVVDDKIIEYDQDNQPDYLGYHLQEDFSTWYGQLDQVLEVKDFERISLSTDGILTYSGGEERAIGEIMHYLLIDDSEINNERLFSKKLRTIEKEWGMENFDDIGIVRINIIV